MKMESICAVDDGAFVEAISSTRDRLVWLSPGVSEPVARALVEALYRLGPERVTIALDIDPEVCRLGYGTLQALQSLKEAARESNAIICHQPGVRIGLLISDHSALVYAPVPLLIETGAPDKTRVSALRLPEVPEHLLRDLGLGPAGVREQRIALDEVPQKQIEAMTADLAANPPLPFDVSRQIRVFNSRVEFVEFNLEKIQLQRLDIQVPQEIMTLVGPNIRGLFRLDPSPELLVEKDRLERSKKDIDKKYTRPMRGFGDSIIKRADKDAFDKEVDRLRAELDAFKTSAISKLESMADRNKKALIDSVLPSLMQNEAQRLDRALRNEEVEDLRNWLNQSLAEPFDRVRDVTEEMKVSVRFKGVTYESLNNPQFQQLASKAFPELGLHEEYTAARAKETADEG